MFGKSLRAMEVHCSQQSVTVMYVCFAVVKELDNSRDVHKLTFFWPSQVANHESSEQVNSQVSSKSFVQVKLDTKWAKSSKSSQKYLT